jgi:hypothetical protein
VSGGTGSPPTAAEPLECAHPEVLETGTDDRGIVWGVCTSCGDDSFVISDPAIGGVCDPPLCLSEIYVSPYVIPHE